MWDIRVHHTQNGIFDFNMQGDDWVHGSRDSDIGVYSIERLLVDLNCSNLLSAKFLARG